MTLGVFVCAALEEQNEELQAIVLNRNVEEGRNLLNCTANSLAQELGQMDQIQVSLVAGLRVLVSTVCVGSYAFVGQSHSLASLLPNHIEAMYMCDVVCAPVFAMCVVFREFVCSRCSDIRYVCCPPLVTDTEIYILRVRLISGFS